MSNGKKLTKRRIKEIIMTAFEWKTQAQFLPTSSKHVSPGMRFLGLGIGGLSHQSCMSLHIGTNNIVGGSINIDSPNYVDMWPLMPLFWFWFWFNSDKTPCGYHCHGGWVRGRTLWLRESVSEALQGWSFGYVRIKIIPLPCGSGVEGVLIDCSQFVEICWYLYLCPRSWRLGLTRRVGGTATSPWTILYIIQRRCVRRRSSRGGQPSSLSRAVGLTLRSRHDLLCIQLLWLVY